MKKIMALMLVATVGTACDRSKPELEQRVLELQTVSAQKDSLIQEVMATTKFVGDLTADLAAVKALNASQAVATQAADLEGKSPEEVRAEVRARVRDLAARVEQSEARLAQSRSRVQNLTSSNGEMQEQLAAYDSTISSLRVVIEGQRTEISQMSEQLLGLQRANVELAQMGEQLTAEKVQLTETVEAMTTESNKVFYVVGTTDELTEKGIITKQGGILGLGGTYTPGRTLEKSDFIELDRTRDLVITLPDAEKTYQLVSVQDTRYLEVQPDKDNKIRAELKIASPEMFWGPSKYLILVRR
jgi:myosin heavy subunit